MGRWIWVAAVALAGCAHEGQETYSSNYYEPQAVPEATVVSIEAVPTGTMNLDERQPVAGGTQVMELQGRDANGQTWRIQDPTLIQQAQQKLSEQGCDPGRTDGRLDARFSEAVRQCQQKLGLPQTGLIDQKTAQALGVDLSSFRTKP